MSGWADIDTLRNALTPGRYSDQATVADALARVEAALDAGDELRLWEPGRKGYAAAQDRFFAALRAVREPTT